MDNQPNQSPQPTPQPEPQPVVAPASGAKKSNFFLLGLGAVAFLAIGLAGGYFLFANKAQPTNTVTNTPNQVVQASPTVMQPSPTVDETANWKTYSNSTLNISFKYPQDWYDSDTKQTATSVLLDTKPIVIPDATDGFITKIFIGLNECTNTVTNKKYPCAKTIPEAVEGIKNLLVTTSIETSAVTIDNVQGAEISGITKPDQPRGDRYIKNIYFPHGEYLLEFQLNDKTAEKTFEQILATLKFDK